MSTSTDERAVYAKLEALKEIRYRTTMSNGEEF